MDLKMQIPRRMIVHEKRKTYSNSWMVLVMGSAFPVSAAESLADFDYRDLLRYTYPDLKAAFGYDAAALYNHYETNGKAEAELLSLQKLQQRRRLQQQKLPPVKNSIPFHL